MTLQLNLGSQSTPCYNHIHLPNLSNRNHLSRHRRVERRNHVITDLHTKPTNLLHQKTSNHYSQVLQIRRICTKDSDYIKHTNHLTQHLWHGYSIEHLHTTNTNSIHTTENQMPKKSKHAHTNIPLVIPYHPALPSVYDITNNQQQILHLSPKKYLPSQLQQAKKSQRPIGKDRYI